MRKSSLVSKAGPDPTSLLRNLVGTVCSIHITAAGPHLTLLSSCSFLLPVVTQYGLFADDITPGIDWKAVMEVYQSASCGSLLMPGTVCAPRQSCRTLFPHMHTFATLLPCVPMQVQPSVAAELLGASDQYLLDGLKGLCETCIAKDLTLENLVDTFELSEDFSAPQLAKRWVRGMLPHHAPCIWCWRNGMSGPAAIYQHQEKWLRLSCLTFNCTLAFACTSMLAPHHITVCWSGSQALPLDAHSLPRLQPSFDFFS